MLDNNKQFYCKICGKLSNKCKTKSKKYVQKYCSRECYYKDYRAIPKHWKGGVSPLREFFRHLDEYKIWRRRVFERDWFRCVECYKKDRKIEAHHIIPFFIILREFLSLYSQFSPIEDRETLLKLAITYKPFWDIENGKTLCLKCHDKYNGEYMKILSTEKKVINGTR